MRNIIKLSIAAILLVLAAGSSFAQQAARTAMTAINPCVSDTLRASLADSQGKTVSRNIASESSSPGDNTAVPECSDPASTTLRANSLNKKVASEASKSETGATTSDEAAQRGWTVVDMKKDWKTIFLPAKK